MESTNQHILSERLSPLTDELPAFVEKEMKAIYSDQWSQIVKRSISNMSVDTDENKIKWDVQTILAVILDNWDNVFQAILGRWIKKVVSDLTLTATRLKNNEPIILDEIYMSNVNVHRLLVAAELVGANEAEVLRDYRRDQIKNRIKKLKNSKKIRTQKNERKMLLDKSGEFKHHSFKDNTDVDIKDILRIPDFEDDNPEV